MFPTPTRLVLASASARRADLLAQIGVVPEIAVPDVDETPLDGESAAAMVERLALDKARSIAASIDAEEGREAFVVGGDTTVLLDQEIMGKPVDAADADRMLRRLSGRDHEVISGVAVVRPGGGSASAIDVTTVTVRTLSDDDIGWYLATGEPIGKAGGYAIQGFGSYLVERLEGAYPTVVGLPLTVVDDLLTGFGVPLRAFTRQRR